MTYQESVWDDSPSLKSYTLANFRQIPHIQKLSEETQFEMEVVHIVAFVLDGHNLSEWMK
jgi:hypothetical protein